MNMMLVYFFAVILLFTSLSTSCRGDLAAPRKKLPSPPPPPKPAFQYFVLTQQWGATFCQVETCSKTAQITTEFTIHGLWPSNSPPIPSPEECDKKDKDILTDLNKYWPRFLPDSTCFQISANSAFWAPEWRTHDTCSNLQPLAYFKLALQKYNINNVLEKLENNGLKMGGTMIAGDIVALIQRETTKVPRLSYATKTDDKTKTLLLMEVGFCLTNDASMFIDCPIPQFKGCSRTNTLLFVKP